MKKGFLTTDEKGYSFIELIMAITILGIVIVPLLSIFTSGYATIVWAGSQTIAVNLAREKVEEVKTHGFNHYAAIMDEEESDDYLEEESPVPGFEHFWRETRITRESRVLSGEEDDDFTIELMVIRVAVFWIRQNVERSVTLHSELAQR